MIFMCHAFMIFLMQFYEIYTEVFILYWSNSFISSWYTSILMNIQNLWNFVVSLWMTCYFKIRILKNCLFKWLKLWHHCLWKYHAYYFNSLYLLWYLFFTLERLENIISETYFKVFIVNYVINWLLVSYISI